MNIYEHAGSQSLLQDYLHWKGKCPKAMVTPTNLSTFCPPYWNVIDMLLNKIIVLCITYANHSYFLQGFIYHPTWNMYILHEFVVIVVFFCKLL